MIKQRHKNPLSEKCHKSCVALSGTIIQIKYNNPFTKAQNKWRQRRFLLTNVYVDGSYYDHVWINSKKTLYHVSIGDSVLLFGKIQYYTDKKWTLHISYKVKK